jgi:hypothetical protein
MKQSGISSSNHPEDSVIINTNVRMLGQTPPEAGFYSMIDGLLAENSRLKKEKASLERQLNEERGAKDKLNIMRDQLDRLESQASAKDVIINELEEQLSSLQATLRAKDLADVDHTKALKNIESRYQHELEQHLEQIAIYRENYRHLRDKEEKKSSGQHQKYKDDFIAKMASISTTPQPSSPEHEGVMSPRTSQFIAAIEKSLQKQYVFDEKIIVDNKVEVDQEVIKLSKEAERLYSRKYPSVQLPLKDKKDNAEPLKVNVLEEVAHIVVANERNQAKFAEELNKVLADTHANAPTDKLPNIEDLFPKVPEGFGLLGQGLKPEAKKSTINKISNRLKTDAQVEKLKEGLILVKSPLAFDSEGHIGSDKPNSELISPQPLHRKAPGPKAAREIAIPIPYDHDDANSGPIDFEELKKAAASGSEDFITGGVNIVKKNVRSMSRQDDHESRSPIGNRNIRHMSQTSIGLTENDLFGSKVFSRQGEQITEREDESQASNPLLVGGVYADSQEEFEDENPLDDYEAKILAGRDNLSYVSNMNTPRSLVLSSPMHSQQQRRFETRNIPMTFTEVSKTKAILSKYHAKPQDQLSDVTPTTAEGRNRRDPLALLLTKAQQSDKDSPQLPHKEDKEIYFASTSPGGDTSKRKIKSQLYLIPERPENAEFAEMVEGIDDMKKLPSIDVLPQIYQAENGKVGTKEEISSDEGSKSPQGDNGADLNQHFANQNKKQLENFSAPMLEVEKDFKPSAPFRPAKKPLVKPFAPKQNTGIPQALKSPQAEEIDETSDLSTAKKNKEEKAQDHHNEEPKATVQSEQKPKAAPPASTASSNPIPGSKKPIIKKFTPFNKTATEEPAQTQEVKRVDFSNATIQPKESPSTQKTDSQPVEGTLASMPMPQITQTESVPYHSDQQQKHFGGYNEGEDETTNQQMRLKTSNAIFQSNSSSPEQHTDSQPVEGTLASMPMPHITQTKSVPYHSSPLERHEGEEGAGNQKKKNPFSTGQGKGMLADKDLEIDFDDEDESNTQNKQDYLFDSMMESNLVQDRESGNNRAHEMIEEQAQILKISPPSRIAKTSIKKEDTLQTEPGQNHPHFEDSPHPDVEMIKSEEVNQVAPPPKSRGPPPPSKAPAPGAPGARKPALKNRFVPVNPLSMISQTQPIAQPEELAPEEEVEHMRPKQQPFSAKQQESHHEPAENQTKHEVAAEEKVAERKDSLDDISLDPWATGVTPDSSIYTEPKADSPKLPPGSESPQFGSVFNIKKKPKPISKVPTFGQDVFDKIDKGEEEGSPAQKVEVKPVNKLADQSKTLKLDNSKKDDVEKASQISVTSGADIAINESMPDKSERSSELATDSPPPPSKTPTTTAAAKPPISKNIFKQTKVVKKS